jgi:hypothetical protein
LLLGHQRNKRIKPDRIFSYAFASDGQINTYHGTIFPYLIYFSRKTLDLLSFFTDNLIGDDENQKHKQEQDKLGIDRIYVQTNK